MLGIISNFFHIEIIISTPRNFNVMIIKCTVSTSIQITLIDQMKRVPLDRSNVSILVVSFLPYMCQLIGYLYLHFRYFLQFESELKWKG